MTQISFLWLQQLVNLLAPKGYAQQCSDGANKSAEMSLALTGVIWTGRNALEFAGYFGWLPYHEAGMRANGEAAGRLAPRGQRGGHTAFRRLLQAIGRPGSQAPGCAHPPIGGPDELDLPSGRLQVADPSKDTFT
jgi:hypothetical protein